MKRVGFHGGSSIFEVGSASDMACFFSLVRHAADGFNGKNIFIDDLYRRYIKQADINKVEAGLAVIKNIFSGIKANADALEIIGFTRENSSLNIDCENMADVFRDHFNGIEFCARSSAAFYADWGISKPLRVVFTEMPWYLEDRNRPLSDYDELEGNATPFWLR